MNTIIADSQNSELPEGCCGGSCCQHKNQIRECPECGFATIKGMPGGRDATCGNCGYKDPCCYDY